MEIKLDKSKFKKTKVTKTVTKKTIVKEPTKATTKSSKQTPSKKKKKIDKTSPTTVSEAIKEVDESVIEYVPDSDDEKFFEYDPTNPLKKKYFIEIAPSSRSKCVRCYKSINQNTHRVGFDSWDVANKHPVSRYYHYRCFATSPPEGIESVHDIQFIQRTVSKYDKNTSSREKLLQENTSTATMIKMLEDAFDTN